MSWLALYVCPCRPGGFLTAYRSLRPPHGPSRCAACGATVQLERPVALHRAESRLGIVPQPGTPDLPPPPLDGLELTASQWDAALGATPLVMA